MQDLISTNIYILNFDFDFDIFIIIVDQVGSDNDMFQVRERSEIN
jgi:hypothetical protein